MDIQPLEILKWIGIVLAAGFVGYFGRYLAMLVIGKIHRKKPDSHNGVPAGQPDYYEDSRLKLEKKKAKQEVKRVKKTGK
jgi:hypothetical protein